MELFGLFNYWAFNVVLMGLFQSAAAGADPHRNSGRYLDYRAGSGNRDSYQRSLWHD